MSLARSAASLPEGNADPTRAVEGAWPRGVSREPVYGIGQLVKILAREFPATTVSKVRFLEDLGLVTPHRTASGYRKYSEADKERIRFVLTRQRDTFAPNRVIGEELAALDAGHDVETVPRARLVAAEGKPVALPSGRAITVSELSDYSGCTPEQLQVFVKLGLIAPDIGGRFAASTVRVVKLLNALVAAGVPAKMLRSVRNGAERNADIIDQVVSASSRRDRPGERARKEARADDLGEMVGDLHAAFLRTALDATRD